jgi:hypothetical protein
MWVRKEKERNIKRIKEELVILEGNMIIVKNSNILESLIEELSSNYYEISLGY